MKSKYSTLLFISISILIGSCQNGQDTNNTISFEKYKIADGFEIQAAAAEPLIQAPVAMDFDNQGRMWVVEMRGFMPNIAGTGEDAPNGRISILHDLDKQGRAQKATVFLDSLVLPRAIALVYGGLLYAAPPNLWFVEIDNDKPGKRTLVDSIYAEEFSNPENQANGLMMGIDNWIYNAYSTSRYQLKDGKWIKEPTSFRGQFGITKDNFGRLYYNYNELQLAGDYVLPNTLINNPYMKPSEGINKALTNNQKIYSLHPTTVNRGYVQGILNKDSILVKFTAACGPLIYRGDQFPEGYSQNAFVCEPEANLVKRNILNFDNLKTTAAQAWDDKEFLASSDEGFRPVNLANGPDGAMYVVDMHRGVMQHIISATPYYKNGIIQKKLDTLINAGRILRIKNKAKSLDKIQDLTNMQAADLVKLLKSSNGWTRDRAQQLLINRNETKAVPELEKLVHDTANTITRIHALRTLEGLNALSFDLLQKAALSGSDMVSAHALLLLENYSTDANIKAMESLATTLMAKNDTMVNLYLAVALNKWIPLSHETFLPILAKLSASYPQSPLYQEAVVSSLKSIEEQFLPLISKEDTVAIKLLDQTIKNKKENKMNSIFVQKKIPVPGLQKGLVIYRSTCAGCHSADGEGIQYVAPPLKESQFIAGPTDRLAMILLYGLEGPINVNGKLYNFNGAMPNFGNGLTDEEIAGVIDYLRNSFVSADPKLSYGRKSVKPDQIKKLRNKRTSALTEKDLLSMPSTGD